MIQTLMGVHEDAMLYFEKTAQELEERYGSSSKAIQACLALLCNTTKPLASRSLLSANEGVQTVLFKVDQVLRNVHFVKSICQRTFPNLTYQDTIGWRMLKDEMGVVVDINSEKIKVTSNGDIFIAGAKWENDGGCQMEILKVLPELKDADASTQGQSRPMYGRGGSSGGRSGGGSSRGGGYHNRGRGGSNNQRR